MEGMISRHEILTKLYNEEYEMLVRSEVAERTLQRVRLAETGIAKNQAERDLASVQFQRRQVKLSLSILFDELNPNAKGPKDLPEEREEKND